MKKHMKIPKIPQKIMVKIYVSEQGYVAELPKYNVHTQASSKEELEYMINDLIYGYFNIPKKYHQKIRYVASKPLQKVEKANSFQVLASPSIFSSISFA